jgi:DNA polymerase-3 subunit beta
MKLRVTKDEMQDKLSNIQNIAEKRNTMPILSHFLLNAGEKESDIIATDIETALKEPLSVTVEQEGKTCIPARKLFEIVKEMEGDLTFETVEEQWLRVTSGKSTFKIACLSPNEFPTWPVLGDAEEITIDAAVLCEMIEKTLYSAGESDTRYTLNGLLFHTKPQDKELIVVGTDGHRLALLKKKIDSEMKEEKKIIIPRKAVSELRRFLSTTKKSEGTDVENVRILIGEKHMLFVIKGVQFLTRLIEGTYPSYENVIPLDNKKTLTVARDNFTKVLRRISVMSRERASAVKCDLDQDTLIVSSSNPDIGEAKEEIAVDYKDEKLSLGFNARYIIDVLGAMISEKVILRLQDPLSPVLMKEEGNEDYRCVIMPMRI